MDVKKLEKTFFLPNVLKKILSTSLNLHLAFLVIKTKNSKDGYTYSK